MDILSLLLCALITWVLVQVLISIATKGDKNRPGRLPPGPAPLPVIGNLLKLVNNPHKSLAELAKTYGPIMKIKQGRITTVVISSPAMAQEVLQKQDLAFSNRAVPDSVHSQNHHQFSVAWMPLSPQWRKLRKISNTHVFSTQKLDANQHLRHQVVQGLIDEVHESCKLRSAVDIGKAAFRTSLNFLSNSIFSLDLSDPRSDVARELKEAVLSIMENFGKPNIADLFPILKKMDPQGIRRQTTADFGRAIGLFDCVINQRLELKKTHGYKLSTDVLDTLLSISEDHGDHVNRDYINHLLLDLFVAGGETTSSTLEWAMSEILHNPRTLLKAQEELEQTIGKGNLVEESDISRLPYLQAVIKETFRLHPPVPMLVPRKVETDVEVCGFTIPKGAQVLVNAWAIGRDPSIWENPDLFMPERFLGSQVDFQGRNFELIPFGAGRRICPGLSLATRMLHSMLGSLISSFDWKLEDGISPEGINIEEKFGLNLRRAQPLLAVPFYM